LYRADLSIGIGEQVFHPFPDIALHLRTLILDCAQDGETYERDQGQRGHEGKHREACLNAPGVTAQECLHE
jgi:hypothetical protein